MHYGTEEQKNHYLPRLANGEAIGTFALTERVGQNGVEGVEARVAGGKLTSTKLPVVDGDIATFAVVLGMGFQGCYGLPGADRYALEQLRRDLATELGVDPDRDWAGGVLQSVRVQDVQNLEAFNPPWHKSLWFGRLMAIAVLLCAAAGAASLFLLT